jgi:hypothetical protein
VTFVEAALSDACLAHGPLVPSSVTQIGIVQVVSRAAAVNLARGTEDFQTSPQTPLGHMIHCYTL